MTDWTTCDHYGVVRDGELACRDCRARCLITLDGQRWVEPPPPPLTFTERARKGGLIGGRRPRRKKSSSEGAQPGA